MAVFFGMMASLLIGVADYFGRYVSRRSAAMATVITMLAVGVVAGLVLVLIVPSEFTARDFGLGAGSGVLVGTAVTLFYAGLARASTAVAAPLVAVGGVLVPLIYGLATGDSPTRLQVIGFAIALLSLGATTFSPELGGRAWAGLGFGSAAGIAFGFSLVMVGSTDIDSGVWSAVGQRMAGAVFLFGLAVAASQPRILPAGLRVRGALCGVLATGGIACYIAGSQRGSLAVVAVSGSMFPAVTAGLAAVFDKDVLRWWQMIGIAGVLTGVGLVAAG